MERVRGTKVLLVEDNEINQQVAMELLASVGADVTVASNGREALDLIDLGHFDVVLMDIQMPEMDGFEATRAIRADDRFLSLPVIAMTANAMKGDRERSLEAGMNDHVTKPIEPEELYAALVRCLPARPSALVQIPAVVLAPATVLPAARPSPSVPSSPELPLRDIPGVDVTAGLQRVQGNQKLYRKLLLTLRDTLPRHLAELQAALAEAQWPIARPHAHTIKGVAANLGAGGIQATAAGVEKLLTLAGSEGTSPEEKTLEEAVHRLVLEISSLVNVLAGYEPSASAPSTFASSAADSGTIDSSRVAGSDLRPEARRAEQLQILEELHALLDQGNPRAANRLSALRESLVPGELSPPRLPIRLVDQLERQIDEYDFEMALETLALLREEAKKT
jgi:CheY-like chemotaxis protein